MRNVGRPVSSATRIAGRPTSIVERTPAENGAHVAFEISLVFAGRQADWMHLVVELDRSISQSHQTDVVVVTLPNEFRVGQYLRNLILTSDQIAGRFAGIVHYFGDVVRAQSNREMGGRITVTSRITQAFGKRDRLAIRNPEKRWGIRILTVCGTVRKPKFKTKKERLEQSESILGSNWPRVFGQTTRTSVCTGY